MGFWPVPDIMTDNIYQIAPRMFTNRGIKFVLLDVDNTIAPYSDNSVSERLKGWVQGLKRVGIEPFILSNNRGDRPQIFAQALEIGYVKRAWKPSVKAARAVLEKRGYLPENTAVVGDQVYTDTLCAKRLGALAVLVHPIKFTNPFLRLRYYLEAPFRLKYSWKKMK